MRKQPATAKPTRRIVAGVELISKRELAEALGCSPATVDRLRKKGVLQPTYLTGKCFFRASDVRAWIQGRAGKAHPAALLRAHHVEARGK